MINGVFPITWGTQSSCWAIRRLWYEMFNLDAPSGPACFACILTDCGNSASTGSCGSSASCAPWRWFRDRACRRFEEVSNSMGEVLA